MLQYPEYNGLSNTVPHTHLATPRRFSEDSLLSPLYTAFPPLTVPPQPVSGNPRIKLERSFSLNIDYSLLPRVSRLQTPSVSNIHLPNLDEFDQGVAALARVQDGQVYPWMPTTSPHPNTARCPIQTYTSPVYSPHTSPPPDAHSLYGHGDAFAHSHDGDPGPLPDGGNRHINQKYTTEEGDFILYAWHDKKLTWQSVKQDFASMFGTTPERTVQGLQTWYYRMNQRIPMWDKDGLLLFENDEALEPKYISIKCRDRDSQDGPLGLAERYPERAIHYHWVDPERKRKSGDWASKRRMQCSERRERRKRKEQHRRKL